MTDSSSLKYHYWYGGVKPLDATAEADMLVMIRGSEFTPNKEVKFENDNGHMGTASTLIDTYRSEATSKPEFSDCLRYGEGWEDILLAAIGSDDGEGNINKTTLATGAYQYNYAINPASPQEPFFMTLKNGYSLTENDAWLYENCLLDSLEVSGSNSGDAPNYKAAFDSNYPKFRQPNVARTIPAITVFPKPANVKIFIAPVGSYTLETIQSYHYPCYQDWNMKLNHNVTSTPCSDNEFGTTTKTRGDSEVTFSTTLLWNDNNKNMEYDFASGGSDNSATEVSDENYYRTVWIVATNGKIGSTNYNYQTIFKLPKVNLTKVDSPQSGTDEKTLSIEGTLTGDNFVEAVVNTHLSDLHIGVPASNP